MVSELRKQAFLFAVKVAMYGDVRAGDLDFLDADEQDYVARMGRGVDSPLNPPPFVADKKIWQKAKKAVKKYWRKYSEPYATVVHVYEQMGGKIRKQKKKKS